MNDDLREKTGKKVATVAIGANCFLTIFNIIIGFLTGSYGLIAEGFHTLSDVATSFIAYIGFRIGQKPADEDHPRGYGRAEALSGLAIVIFLTMVGYEIIDTAKDKLLDPRLITTPSYLAIGMALFGIVVNYIISQYIIKKGEEMHSPAMIADGKHQMTDIFSSVAVIIGVIVSNMGYPMLDPIVGLFIGLIILKTAYSIGKENIDNILGKVKDKNLIKDIERIANETPDAYEAHEITIDNFGSYVHINLHVKVDGDLTVNQAHKIVHNVEKNILKEKSIVKSVSVHACPLGTEHTH